MGLRKLVALSAGILVEDRPSSSSSSIVATSNGQCVGIVLCIGNLPTYGVGLGDRDYLPW